MVEITEIISALADYFPNQLLLEALIELQSTIQDPSQYTIPLYVGYFEINLQLRGLTLPDSFINLLNQKFKIFLTKTSILEAVMIARQHQAYYFDRIEQKSHKCVHSSLCQLKHEIVILYNRIQISDNERQEVLFVIKHLLKFLETEQIPIEQPDFMAYVMLEIAFNQNKVSMKKLPKISHLRREDKKDVKRNLLRKIYKKVKEIQDEYR